MEHVTVAVPVGALLRAIARTPQALRGVGEGPFTCDDDALEALLEDFLRDRLLLPGPYPHFGTEVRVPAPPRDVPFRRHVALAASVISDPEVAPSVRLALAWAGPKAPHPLRRLAQVADALLPVVDPAAPLVDPQRAEELARRLAAAFHMTLEGESAAAAGARLAEVDSREAVRAARDVEERKRDGEIAWAIAAAAAKEPPPSLLPEWG